MEDITRTLLLYELPKGVGEQEIRKKCEKYGEVRDVFTMQNNLSCFFVSFFSLKDSQKAFSGIQKENKEIKVLYTIDQCEIPRGSDQCTEDKSQGTIQYTSSTEYSVEDSSQVKRSEKSKNNIVVEFFDSRDALAFMKKIKTQHPRSSPHFLWDRDLRKRRNLLLAAEKILKAAPAIIREPQQKRKAPEEVKKKVKESSSYWILNLFDKYIRDHASEISEIIE
ncbi:hypothetical protein NEFER03_2191 [Nematocida sp. LUAm3]|nr:hypothetical protein NEFER03_2191 [Nematocida sp. LUAm3]KAI5176299.1 hypothetical protein NEFER02_2091 [Nematocida sp. LUAm2]KAI5179229.1 hypothetical protein NEFER01_2083 [Nematocida sp. LUAm1]